MHARRALDAAVLMMVSGFCLVGMTNQVAVAKKQVEIQQLSPECKKLIERHETERDKFTESEKTAYLSCIWSNLFNPGLEKPSPPVPTAHVPYIIKKDKTGKKVFVKPLPNLI